MNKANQIIDFAKQAIIESSSQTTLDAPINKRVAYAVSHGKSYASNGYAIRTHGIAAALNKRGFDTLCLIRPGRPWDFGAKREFSELQKEVGGVTYIHSPWENFLVPKDVFERIKVMALKYEELFKVYRPEIVLAASNYEVAFPAYIAAKKLGLPFHYEVRGFWEVSRLSRDPDWEDSDGYHEQVELESFLVSNADKLYTLNTSMVQELVKRGANRASISLVPNAAPSISNVESKNIKPRNELFDDYEDTFLLGYVGALTDYEGIDTLLQAIASLKDEKIKLLVVGGNNPVNDSDKRDEVLERFKKQAIELGLQNQVVFTGRVAHEAVGNYIRAVDACVVPRKPDLVCELVSALKPLEYMAFNKPVIASNVAPQVELLANGKFGWLYEKGNVQSLCESITKLRSEDKRVIQEKLAAARKLIEEKLTWGCVVEPMIRNLCPKFKVTQFQDRNARKTKIACIMDDFTFTSYSPEADLFQLTPHNYEKELTEFEPELLFIESAWRGKDDLWGSKVGHRSREVVGIVDWCKKNNIPTIFWNKEDPVHFETFLNTAKLFDFVFTTDLDCIHRYKAALKHDRVFFLPFAFQPKDANPIEEFKRKDAFCFAGAYYVKYPERTKDLENFVKFLPKFKPVEIYDRNFGKNDENYMFPELYRDHIVGTLPFSEIKKAYKGYRYAINLNSVKQSQSMFARRVFELLANNTVTISNFSRGVRALLGDLVFVSDSGKEIIQRLNDINKKEFLEDKIKLAGLRKVLSEHTYSDRMNYILDKTICENKDVFNPCFVGLSKIYDIKQLDNVVCSIKNQSLKFKRFILVINSEQLMSEVLKRSFTSEYSLEIYLETEINASFINSLISKGNWIAFLSPLDYYGSNYLKDIALTRKYSNEKVIGKSSYFKMNNGNVQLLNSGNSYLLDKEFSCRSCAFSIEVTSVQFEKLMNGQMTFTGLSIDSFNYCENLTLYEKNYYKFKKLVDDIEINTGLSLKSLEKIAENIKPDIESETHSITYKAAEIFECIPSKLKSKSEVVFINNEIEVKSPLKDGEHEYIYFKDATAIRLEKLNLKDKSVLPIHYEVSPGLNISLAVFFLDQNKKKAGHIIIKPNKNNSLLLPKETAFVNFAFRIYQSGTCYVKNLIFGEKDLSPKNILGDSETLLISNNYPSYDDLYKNGFVHSRVKAYKSRGKKIDVFRFKTEQAVSWHEFQNIDVITGGEQALSSLLESGRYKTVLVHFLDNHMWSILSKYIDDTKVVVWLHGAEIHPWYRRKFNITSESHKEKLIEQSNNRIEFWKSILVSMHKNLKIVFVSQSFAEEVFEDLGFELPRSQYQIIHNPINTDLFAYRQKNINLRKKILSIRPFASRQYANDITVDAILKLSSEPFFEELEFRIIGDGPLFEETLEPIANFDNVFIEKRFVPQSEIPQLHEQYGIFLCPTRWDSQGVSRDEAMSSGMAIVTTNTAAIPEFTDPSCAMVARDESSDSVAAKIKNLIEKPSLFSQISANAAKRIRNTICYKKVIPQECKLFE